MAEERVQRRLAAIRATGVVGYSRLMEEECRQWALASSIAVLSFTNFSGRPRAILQRRHHGRHHHRAIAVPAVIHDSAKLVIKISQADGRSRG
jgi:hypothetical protein